MNRLVINTANSDLIVAIKKDNKIFSKIETNVKKHNEIILDFVQETLTDSGLKLNDIDEFGVVVGPGSFTGIRVGIATIKAFNNATKKITKAINNLDFLYELSKQDNIEVVAIEGSLNSFFVGEVVNDKFYIYPRNLSCDELKEVANDRVVACFQISTFMENCGITFKKVDIEVEKLFDCQTQSNETTLTPVYYQLSQAENDKINRGKLEIVEYSNIYFDKILLIENENFIESITGDKAWSGTILKSCLESANNLVYLAILNGELAGYIVGEKTDEINLSRVAVKKEFQNHGIATKLIEKLYLKAKENDMNLSLEVSEHNITAKKLYEKLGFIMRRVRSNYYKDGSSCIEMVKVK